MVSLDDVKHELNASEQIEYTNNSPDELTYIYFHLWPNAYKDINTALSKQKIEDGNKEWLYAKENDRGYMDGLKFKVNGIPVKVEYDSQHNDICKIILIAPLKSKQKIIITTPFHVKIPKGGISRLGHINQQYQISQWYPKPAVYDVNGWNPMPYLDQGEFYSEYGSFDVFITLPKNYVVGATGDLVDGEKELQWLEEKSKTSDTLFKKIISDTIVKMLHYKQSNVHDFAWFADKNYHILKGEVELPHSKRKVTTWAMYNDEEAELWKNSIQYINDAVYYYSLWIGDYPYNQATAVYGGLGSGGGMEYPNVTVIGNTSSAIELETVIVHEVGHNWFYGILGSNERIHPWMDEGINSFYENRYTQLKHPDEKLLGDFSNKKIARWFGLEKYGNKYETYLGYIFGASQGKDQSMNLHSTKYSLFNYATIVYGKSALAFNYLLAFLGEKKLDEAMQAYFENWKFKHPEPSDIQKELEQATGRDLNWLFKDIITSTGRIDYKVCSIKKTNEGSYDIVVKNKGNIQGPVSICGIKNDRLVGMVWYDGFKGKQTLGFPPSEIDYFKIDYQENIPEINRNNNRIRTNGIFKKTEPLRLQLLGSLDDPDKTQLFYTPIIGWNNYNKFMLGMALYNITVPQKKLEYILIPMYAFGNKDISGYGNVTYNINPYKGMLRQISLGASAKRYAYTSYPFSLNYNIITPEINFYFRRKNKRVAADQILKIRNINILQETYFGKYEFTPPVYGRDSSFKNFIDVSYSYSMPRKINPYDITLNIHQGDKMAKAFVTANYQFSYKGKKKGLDIRFFSGIFIGNSNAGPYRFRMSGQHGAQDYFYDHIFLARTDYSGNLSQQFTETDGGFKVPTPLGQTTKWITALNLKTSLPFGKLPIRLFADIGTADAEGLLKKKVLYDAGFNLSVIKDIFEIYFPFAMSTDIKENLELNGITYRKTIRFTLNLSLLNPFYQLKNSSF